jgi:hypothetical protein
MVLDWRIDMKISDKEFEGLHYVYNQAWANYKELSRKRVKDSVWKAYMKYAEEQLTNIQGMFKTLEIEVTFEPFVVRSK